MSLTVKSTGGSGYSLLEAGTYPARCVGVIDLGVQHNGFNGKDQEKVRIVWELPEERVETEEGDKPKWMSLCYTASLYEKSKLRQHLDAWRGKPFSEEELAGFDLKNIVGAACMLAIVHKERESGTRAVVGGVSKMAKGISIPPMESKPFVFDMDAPDAEEVLETLPQWMQDEITRSTTWQNRETPELHEEGTVEDDGDLPF